MERTDITGWADFGRASLCSMLVVLATLAFAPCALAHQVGLSRGDYMLEGSSLRASLVFAQPDAIELVAGLDADGDGKLTSAEIDAYAAPLQRALVERIQVQAGGVPCPGTLVEARLDEQDGLSLEARYRCPEAAPGLGVDVSLLRDLPTGHRHLARALWGGKSDNHVLSSEEPSFSIKAPVEGEKASKKNMGSLFTLGVEHILTGYDHLVFLFGLLLLPARLGALLGVVTAFTLAHSITLGLSALGVLAPSPSLVEPLIALSIAYVGVENFWLRDASKRWRITFPFGLVHGFGFAGALRELSLAREEVPAALFSFNLGVEAGQLAVLAILVPALFYLRKKKLFDERIIKALSALVVALGLFWFIARLSSS